MGLQTALREIHSIPRFPEKPGLRRIQSLLKRMGNPQEGLPFVHIAGTNGKGSTTAMLAEILQQAGYRTGRFVSPYVLEFRERIQVNGEMIPPRELCGLWEQVKFYAGKMAQQEGMAPSEFEVVTAMAMEYFRRQSCQVVALEVGLGGRFDATNVIPAPLAAVITSVGLDHTQYLGDTIEKIALEKCGILKPGTVAITCPNQDPKALAVIRRRTQEEGVPLIVPASEDLMVRAVDLSGSRVQWRGIDLALPLVGAFQLENLATVLGTVEALRKQGWQIPDQAVQAGIARTRFPARMERFGTTPLVFLDGAHNPPGALALAKTLDGLAQGRPVTLLMGMMGDKAVEQVLDLLLPRAQGLVTVPIHIPRAMAPEQLADLARQRAPHLPVQAATDLEQGLRLALEKTAPEGVLLICGSLYLAGEIRPLLLEEQKWGQ